MSDRQQTQVAAGVRSGMKHYEVKKWLTDLSRRSLSAITEISGEICEFAMVFWCIPER
jgi:hypothetical protein